jgi:hypothetical protein
VEAANTNINVIRLTQIGTQIHEYTAPGTSILTTERYRFNNKIKCATFNNFSVISWLSDSLVEETGVPGEYYRPVASH